MDIGLVFFFDVTWWVEPNDSFDLKICVQTFQEN